jgi:choline-sulfatase
MTTQPNILLIMSEEHDPAVTVCYGDPVVQTPNLDRLADTGVLFESCYCNSPLCVPSRLSFTAGKYVSRVGAWNNEAKLPSDDFPGIVHSLNRAGYRSYLCGKQHYDREHRYGFTDLMPDGWSNAGDQRGGGHRRAAGDYSVDEQLWWNRSKEFHTGNDSTILSHDRLVSERASAFLAQQDGSSPFFLFAGYLAQHFPLIVPEDIHQRYVGRVPMPELPHGALEVLPGNYRHHRVGFGEVLCDEETTRHGRELYWALVDWFDRQVGTLLNVLHANPAIRDDTVVIYTADHGENKGDHGLWWKNCMYEHGARVPLIVSWPARWAGGQRRTEACSLVDLVQTLAELGEAELPADCDGESLLPWPDEPGLSWKDRAVSEYYSHPICSGFQMLREGEWKYVYQAR